MRKPTPHPSGAKPPKLSKTLIPNHVAVVMDGNGRWAKQRGLPRTAGHEAGEAALFDLVEGAIEIGVKEISAFAFSTENWNRPKMEVELLMSLLINSLKNELKTLQENNIRLNSIGNLDLLPKSAQKKLQEVIETTKNNSRMVLTLALSYGSREELINAVKNISNKVKNNIISIDKIDESIINQHLYTRDLPEVDLLIRTSGEHRISNFLLWQIAYSELYFTDVLWPDFKEDDLYQAIISYQKRERRFGKTSEQIK